MKQIIKLLAILLLISLLAACAPASTPQPPSDQSFVDGLGREITLPDIPARIVSLAPSNTELLFAVGAGAQVIGRDEFSDYPVDALVLPSVGGSMGKFSLEQIAALQPDLVLASELNSPELIQSMADMGLTVYYLPNPVDVSGVLENIRTVGMLTGHTSEADVLVTGLQKRIEAAVATVDRTQPVKIFYELDGASDPAKPWTVGSSTFIDELITQAGGVNVASSAGAGYLQLSQEALVLADPDIILLGDAAYGVTVESLATRPGWESLSAVVNGRVYTFDDNLVSRPGPRLVDGLEQIVILLGQ
jgi:iron complex transport system substrate-binding protein